MKKHPKYPAYYVCENTNDCKYKIDIDHTGKKLTLPICIAMGCGKRNIKNNIVYTVDNIKLCGTKK